MAPDDLLRPEMTPEELRLLGELIHAHCGLRLREDQRYLVERRLAPRLKANGLTDFTAYYRLLRFDPRRGAELEEAVEALATNETYFFREPMQLKSFREELLPALAKEKERSRKLRIWSAGCSSGEEAYTLAILIKESGRFFGWDVEVFGSDISRGMISRARRGVYSRSALRETPEELLARHFTAEADGRFQVSAALKQQVAFGHMNLLDERSTALLGKMDVIFCRNVMIYFDLEARRRLLKAFWAKLHEGGYLLLGHSESLINLTADFELVNLEHDLIYRKPPSL